MQTDKEISLDDETGLLEVTDWSDMSKMFFTRDEVLAMLAKFDKTEDL